MRIGLHTNAFAWAGELDIEKVADYAVSNGYNALELGPMYPLDYEKIKKVQEKIDISAMIYCRNFIDDDVENAEMQKKELRERMYFANKIGVKKVIISTGISQSASMEDGRCDPLKSLEKVVDFLEEFLKLAEELDIYLLIENCPMYRNIGTSPFMWREIFKRVPNKRLGICYDPAHFVWQMIDVYAPMQEFADRIHHFHLKDTYLFKDKLNDVGILHNTAKEQGLDENQWWRHTILGKGEIDWNKFFKLALECKSPLIDMTFEMEDYLYEKDVEKVKKAFTIQMEDLKKYINV